MSRTAAPNMDIVAKIRSVFRNNPRGVWIREIARQSGVSKSCVHVYITQHMANDVEEVLSVSGLVKLYRLKTK